MPVGVMAAVAIVTGRIRQCSESVGHYLRSAGSSVARPKVECMLEISLIRKIVFFPSDQLGLALLAMIFGAYRMADKFDRDVARNQSGPVKRETPQLH